MNIRETWREAALRDVRQFYADKHGVAIDWNRAPRPTLDDDAQCGVTALAPALKEPIYLRWEYAPCPVEGCGTQHSTLMLIAHLNDVHRWGFLDLANKFPPILPEDVADVG